MAWKPTLHFECPPPPPPVRGTRRGRKVVTPPVIQVKVLNHQENGPSNGSNTVNWVSISTITHIVHNIPILCVN